MTGSEEKKGPAPIEADDLWAIVNPYGDFWGPLTFQSPAEAYRHIETFWRFSPRHNSGFDVIPVKVRIEALATQDPAQGKGVES